MRPWKSLLFCLAFAAAFTSCSSQKKASFVAKKAKTSLGAEANYSVDGQTMKGHLAIPEGKGPFPAVLVVHEWWGLNDFPKQRAMQFAESGYVALAIDLYGEGQIFEEPTAAKTHSTKVMANLEQTEQNFKEAIQLLRKHPQVRPEQIAIAGYGFGGAVVLEMARRNLPGFQVAISYHGDLSPLAQNEVGPIKSRILIFNGADDPMVNPKILQRARKNLKAQKVRYKLVNYKDARHSFTNPEATLKGQKFDLPLAYNKKADEDSWDKTLKALKSVFKR